MITECWYDDIRIRKVAVLGDRARKLAEKMGLAEDDLVILKTRIIPGRPPIYELEKIVGSPMEYLQKRMQKSEKR